MKTLEWKDDEFGEQKMREFGAAWTIAPVPTAAISVDCLTQNPARSGQPLCQSLVDDYADMMVSGDVFPRVILYGQKKMSIISGHHRIGAVLKIGIAEVEAYICEAGQDWELLARVCNRGHGRREERDEAILNAIWATKKPRNMSIKEAAARFGLNPDVLQVKIRADAVRNGLIEAGVQARGLPESTILKIGAIPTDSVRAAAARLIATRDMAGSNVDAFLRDVKAQTRSEAAQMGVVARYESDIPANDHPRTTAGPRTHPARPFMAALKTVETSVDGKRRISDLGITDASKKADLKKRLHALSKKLAAISNS